MASKEANTIRVAVGSKDDLRSSVWRLWANGKDLYLAARSFAGTSKISFHKSGIHRWAINANVQRENPASDRALFKWSRSKEVVPGWTRGFAILVPPRITKQPFPARFEDKKPMQFVKPPRQTSKVLFNVILSHRAARAEHVERGSVHKIAIHGYVEMREELAWLVSFYDNCTPQEYARFVDHFNKLKIHLKPGSTGDDLQSAFLHIIEEADPPCVIDIELGKENLDIPTIV